MSAGAERVFLGWDGPLLDRTAEWLHERFGEDMRDVLVAVPGARAARALRERLARRAGPGWYPPRLLTQGALTDEIVRLERPVADRLQRTLAWARALSELPPESLSALTARVPAPQDARAWWRLAEAVRDLHGELAQEGVSFATVAEGPAAAGGRGEVLRWRALARAQSRWRGILDGLGLADPHEARFAAIEAGRVDDSRRAVLVGVADVNRLLRHLLERLGDRVTALVFAPASEASAFDELGCLRTEAWKDRDLDLPLARWRVVAGPAEVAACAVDLLASLDGRYACAEISIGICDEDVAPYLERRLAEEGIVARRAAGTPLARTRPFRLLTELAAWLPRRAFADLAVLLRQPDVERAVRARGAAAGARAPDVASAPDRDVVAALDGYHAEHLPGAVDGHWLGAGAASMRALHAALLGVLGELGADDARPLSSWPERVRAFLVAVFPDALHPEDEGERVLAESLSALGEVLGEIERLPDELGATAVAATQAVELVLLLAAGESVRPRAVAPGESAIELPGWLDLPLDDARVLVVTGFQEGSVPRSRRGDPFLPDGLRRRLGLPDAAARVARDLYASTVLLRAREEVFFVSARRSRDGDPLLPSRLAFHVDKTDLPARVDHLVRSGSAPSPAVARSKGERYALPRLAEATRVESMSVSDFKTYLRSPYAFYVQQVLGLDAADDSAREMDASAFGRLAHEVLEAFGRSSIRDSSDAREIEPWLRASLARLGRARFGTRALPAVELQLAQLERRLGFFASAQAARAAEGWRIVEVEWSPSRPVALDMGDAAHPMPLRGRIDRVEVNEARRAWAILDYKTGREKDPERTHRKSGAWTDLQLPLYTLLARELGQDGDPELGYFGVGGDEAGTGVFPAGWSRPELEDALDAARSVVRRVSAGEFFELGPNPPDEPVFAALAGRGLVEAAGEEEDE